MANAAFHKKQAEALIIEVNKGNCIYPDRKIALAKVHAILATVPDDEESF